MTQPTQEDKIKIAEQLLNAKVYSEGPAPGLIDQTGPHVIYIQIPNGGRYDIKNFNPYTDDSFTGALVKAVFPLIAEKFWYIRVFPNGDVDLYYAPPTNIEDPTVDSIQILTAPNLNTALIEAWKKIEGEKK